MSTSRSFGIETHRVGEEGNEAAADGDWAIYLPHQCDDWIVARSQDREAMLDAARQFRAELDQAISEIERP
jgi:hypothetical protein